MLDSDRFTVDRMAHEIRFTRRIAATPERLFAAWTTPGDIARWWDPSGTPLAEAVVDPVLGGTLRLTHASGHSFTATFTWVDPPRGFGWSAMGADSAVTFTPVGDLTAMVVTIACGSEEGLERFLSMGIAEGTAVTLDNLEERLG
ncbi:SRPBCC domain-containing protein [uncultured Maritimibacter sp.]|jgi:uncharacterized protein YndB with AHSA1/START domain|uniref:SRPBCC family protein n=1 Tax=uncultured Maritimibacter sp. TaxID=991866 RepID=UPI00260F6448|nr:SRPBCC domain-containing protein [uncultured Maritimibacter sp.]